MTLLPKVKLRAAVNFPANATGRLGIDVVKQNGNFFLDLAYSDFVPPVGGLLPADVPNLNALLWNIDTGQYVLSPISLLGGGAGGGIPPGETAGFLLQTNGVGSFPTWAGFRATGLGSVIRTWRDKASDSVNARDYGVIADGVANDTAAMNAALAAAAGKKLIVPPGFIVIAAPLNPITTNGTYIEGPGPDAVKFVVTHSTGDTITFSGMSGGGITGCSFTPPAVPRTAGAYVKIQNSDKLWINQNHFNQGFYGIHRSQNTGLVWIENNQWQVAAGGSGIFLTDGCGNMVISGNLFMGSLTAPPRSAINLAHCEGIWLNYNDSYQCGDGLLINPGPGQQIVHIFGNANAWDSGTENGIRITSDGGLCQRLRFVNDWTASNLKRGILIEGFGNIQGFSYVNGFIYTNGLEGVAIAPPLGSNFLVSNCAIAGNGYSISGAFDGISVQPGINGVQIFNNRIGPVDGFPNTQRFGVNVAAGTGNGIMIVGNDTRGNLNSGIVNGATGTQNIVANNLGFAPPISGITVGASPFTYTASASPETVYITGGTVSVIAIDGLTVLQSSNHAIALRPNQVLSVTYSVAPSMNRSIN